MTYMTPALRVFYDGACSLCIREIGFFRRQRGADAVEWTDVSALPDKDAEVATGLTQAAAMGHFHVQRPNGELVAGGRAFAELWSALPAFALAGRIGRTAPVAKLLDVAYNLFLPVRPYLQKLAGGPACAAPRSQQ